MKTNGGLPIITADGNLAVSPEIFAAGYAVGLVYDGPATRAANGGSPLPLYFSDPTHSRFPDDVMFVSPAVGFARHPWSARDIGVLTDLGYQIVPESSAWLLSLLGASGLVVHPIRRRSHR